MSAMTEAFDMPMADFSADFDIQMQPSTSDPWYQELEAKMEEDGPTLYKIDESPSKNMAIALDKADGGIEVDMEPIIEEYNAEYEMVDDEHFHAPADLHDVELHDADVSIELEESHPTPAPPLPLVHSVPDLTEGFTIAPTTMENTLVQPSISQPDVPNLQSEIPASIIRDSVSAVIPNRVDAPQQAIPSIGPTAEFHVEGEYVQQEHLPEHPPAPAVSSASISVPSHEAHTLTSPEQKEPAPILPVEPVAESTAVPQEAPVEAHVVSEAAGLDEPHVDNKAETSEAPSGIDLAKQQWNEQSDVPDTPHVDEENHQETVNDIVASTGDPHEISDGVYIDPPPPILLSLGLGDDFDLCLFNNGEDSLHHNQANEHVLLANFPTLYYESLSYIFEALRCEERVYQAFNLAECELVLEAPDLQLTVSEDNIHARDVTLHDLNILHDVSGLDGLLRIKLSQSLPRFIYRYQRLQDEVNRLHLDVGTDEQHPAEGGDVNHSLSNDERGQDHSSEKHQVEDEAQLASESHHEVQGDPQPDDDQGAYADDSYDIGGVESNLDDAHDEFPEDDREHAKDDSSAGEDKTSSLSHSGEIDHSTADEQVVSKSQFELSNDAGSEAVHPSEEVDGEAGGEHQVDDDAEAEFDVGTDDADGDVEGGSEEYGDFDDGEHNKVDEGEYEAGDDDRMDNAPSGSDTVGPNNTSTDAPADNTEDVLGAEDYDPQDLGDGAQNDSTYDQDEVSAQHDEYGEEEHLEPLQDDVESTTDTTTGNSEPTNTLEPDVLREEVLQSQGDRQFESVTLDSLEGAGPDSSQSDIPSSKDAHNVTEDSHLDPAENAHDFEDDTWAGELDGDGEFEDDTWDEDGAEIDNENAQSHSNESSVTLSSKASKRSFDEFELDDEGYEDESGIYGTPPSSPGAKRTRTR